MNSLIFSLGLTIVLACFVNAEPQCHTSEIMQCVNIAIDWVHTLPKRSIAETDQQLDTMCEEVGKAVDCALKYRDTCTTPLQKEILGLLLEGFFDFRTNFCPSGSALRTRYLTHAPCMNKVAQSDDIKELVEYNLAVVENMAKQEHKNMIMYSCCGYRKLYGDIKKLSIDNCGEDALNTLFDFVHMFTAQTLEVVCNNVDGTEDSCVALLPPAGTKISGDAKSTQIYQFLKNALSSWIDL